MAGKVRLPSVSPSMSPSPLFPPVDLAVRCHSFASQLFFLSGGNFHALPLAYGVALGILPCGDRPGACGILASGV